MTSPEEFMGGRRGPRVIEAEHTSWCAGSCGEQIEPGDEIAWSEEAGTFVHVECHEDEEGLRRD